MQSDATAGVHVSSQRVIGAARGVGVLNRPFHESASFFTGKILEMMPIRAKAPPCVHHVSGSPVPEGSGLRRKPHILGFLQ